MIKLAFKVEIRQAITRVIKMPLIYFCSTMEDVKHLN